MPPLHEPHFVKFYLGLLCVPVCRHYTNRILLSFSLILCSCPVYRPLPRCCLCSLAVIVETSWFHIVLAVVRASCVVQYRKLPPFLLVGVRPCKRLTFRYRLRFNDHACAVVVPLKPPFRHRRRHLQPRYQHYGISYFIFYYIYLVLSIDL